MWYGILPKMLCGHKVIGYTSAYFEYYILNEEYTTSVITFKDNRSENEFEQKSAKRNVFTHEFKSIMVPFAR